MTAAWTAEPPKACNCQDTTFPSCMMGDENEDICLVQAGTTALCALVRACGGAEAFAGCPAATRALVGVGTGATAPAAQFKLAPTLQAHVTRLLQHARQQACGALAALAEGSESAARLLEPYAGEIFTAALQPGLGAGTLAAVVAALARTTTDAEQR